LRASFRALFGFAFFVDFDPDFFERAFFEVLEAADVGSCSTIGALM
jgi:hypothetical protein